MEQASKLPSSNWRLDTFGPNLLLEEKLLDEVALPESQKYHDPLQNCSLTNYTVADWLLPTVSSNCLKVTKHKTQALSGDFNCWLKAPF